MYCREDAILEAFEAGVAGFLPKETSLSDLKSAVRAVLRGESVLSPKISKIVEAHGGSIRAEAAPKGQGAAFVIELPRG